MYKHTSHRPPPNICWWAIVNTGSPDVAYSVNMDKIWSIRARLEVDNILLKNNFKICNISKNISFPLFLCVLIQTTLYLADST